MGRDETPADLRSVGWEGQQLRGSSSLFGRSSESCVADGGCVFGSHPISSRWFWESNMQVQDFKNGVQGIAHALLQTCSGMELQRSGTLADCGLGRQTLLICCSVPRKRHRGCRCLCAWDRGQGGRPSPRVSSEGPVLAKAQY